MIRKIILIVIIVTSYSTFAFATLRPAILSGYEYEQQEAKRAACINEYRMQGVRLTGDDLRNKACIDAYGEETIELMIKARWTILAALVISIIMTIFILIKRIKAGEGTQKEILLELAISVIIIFFLVFIYIDFSKGCCPNLPWISGSFRGSLLMLLIPPGVIIARKILSRFSMYLREKTSKVVSVTKKSIQKSEQIIKRGTVADELLKWSELKEKGLITEEEFEEQKQKLLSSIKNDI